MLVSERRTLLGLFLENWNETNSGSSFVLETIIQSGLVF